MGVQCHPALDQRVAGAIGDRAAITRHRQVAGVLAGNDRVDELSRCAVKDSRSAVAQRQCRAIGDRQRFARRQRERHRLSGIEVAAVRRRIGHRGYRRCRGVDLDMGVKRDTTGYKRVARGVADRTRIAGHREVIGVVARRDRVDECQRCRSRPAAIDCGCAVVQRERSPTRNRQGFARRQRERH